MKEAGVDIDIVEDGKSFEENAMIKASAIAELPEVRAMDAIVLADDSGLEIDYLNKNRESILRAMQEPILRMISRTAPASRMKGVPDKQRTARFVCAVAAVFPNGTKRLSVERWKDVLVTKSPEQMDLATIRSFSCRNTVAPRRACTGKEE